MRVSRQWEDFKGEKCIEPGFDSCETDPEIFDALKFLCRVGGRYLWIVHQTALVDSEGCVEDVELQRSYFALEFVFKLGSIEQVLPLDFNSGGIDCSTLSSCDFNVLT